MDKPYYSPDQYNRSILPFYDTFFINMSNAFSRALSNSRQFNTELFNIFAEAYSMYLGTISEYNRSWKDLAELEKILRSKYRKLFNEKFREIIYGDIRPCAIIIPCVSWK